MDCDDAGRGGDADERADVEQVMLMLVDHGNIYNLRRLVFLLICFLSALTVTLYIGITCNPVLV